MITEIRTQEKKQEKQEAKVLGQGSKSCEHQEFRHVVACLEDHMASGKVQRLDMLRLKADLQKQSGPGIEATPSPPGLLVGGR